MSRAFAPQVDMAHKVITFEELGPGLYADTAKGDPNSGVIIDDEEVLVVDAQATPVMASSSPSASAPVSTRSG